MKQLRERERDRFYLRYLRRCSSKASTSQSIFKIRRIKWLLADTSVPRQLEVDNFHHSQWPFLFPPIAVRDYLRSRNISEKNDKPSKT